MGLASGITSVPNAAIVLALPTIHREFDTSLTTLEFTVTGYLLTYSTLLIAAGRLADMFGRVRVLVIGTLVYMGASVGAALAPDSVVLILGMVIVGVGAAVLTPASLAIVTDAFRGEKRGLAVGIWGGATALFSGIGPLLGGFFTDEMSWRWILWINVIIGALILVGVRGARETRDERAGDHIDVTGLLLSVLGLAAFILALNEAPDTWAFSSPQVIGLLVGGALMLVAFVFVERRAREPLIDLRMFAQRNLSGASVVVFVLNFAFGAVLFFIPIYLQEILGDDPLKAGALLLPASATMVVSMPLGGRLYERLGPTIPIVAGMAMAGVAMAMLGSISPSTDYGDLWFPLALVGLGIGTALTPMNLAALNAVERRRHGTIGAIMTTLSGLGAAFGVAVSGAVFDGLQTTRTVDNAADSGITLTRSAAETLQGILPGTPSATKALDAYPAAQQAQLKTAIDDAFVSALGTTMLISVGVVAVGIVLTLLLIRNREPVEEMEPAPNVADPFPGATLRP